MNNPKFQSAHLKPQFYFCFVWERMNLPEYIYFTIKFHFKIYICFGSSFLQLKKFSGMLIVFFSSLEPCGNNFTSDFLFFWQEKN